MELFKYNTALSDELKEIAKPKPIQKIIFSGLKNKLYQQVSIMFTVYNIKLFWLVPIPMRLLYRLIILAINFYKYIKLV